MAVAERWRQEFFEVVRDTDAAQRLRSASLDADLAMWTSALTDAVVETCSRFSWIASAKGHRQALLPESRSEYLSIDVMALPNVQSRWQFPVAAVELENSTSDDRIAYSLWKVVCIRCDLRLVFCYRKDADEGAPLVRRLAQDVVGALPLDKRVGIEGESMVIVGSRGEAATFPYGFFKWWKLDLQTGSFQLI